MALAVIAVLVAVALMAVAAYSAFLVRTCSNGPHNCESELVALTRGRYNPSLSRDAGGRLLVMSRRSSLMGHSIVHKLRNVRQILWPSVRSEQIVVTRANGDEYVLETPYDSTWMRYNLCEDPRVFHAGGDTYHVIVTVHHVRGEVTPALLTTYLPSRTSPARLVPLECTGPNKNWTLFRDSQRNLRLLTDLFPIMRIRSVDVLTGRNQIVVEHDTTALFEHPLRGTSAPVAWSDGLLICAGHWANEVSGGLGLHRPYQTVFVVFEAAFPHRVRAHTDSMSFVDGSVVEFCSGLLPDGPDHFLLGLGCDDSSARILRVARASLAPRLRWAPAPLLSA